MIEVNLIIAGGRDFADFAKFKYELESYANSDEFDGKTINIVSGMARGADALGAEYARKRGIKLHEFPADWDRYGKRAGFMRNEQMAQFSQYLIAFWDGRSRGTAHMIQTMRRLNKPVRIVNY